MEPTSIIHSSFNQFPGYAGRIPSSGCFNASTSHLYRCLGFCLLHVGCTVVFYDQRTQDCIGENDTDMMTFLGTLIARDGSRAYRLSTECDNAGYVLNRRTGQCLKVVMVKKSWADALSDCESDGGVLAKLDTVERTRGAAEIAHIYMTSPKRFFVGASDIVSEGSWIWLDGTPVQGIPGFFNNEDTRFTPAIPANCGLFIPTVLTVSDIKCFAKKPFICERKDLEP